MKKFLIIAAAATAAAGFSAPAAAEHLSYGRGYGYSYGGMTERLQSRIERGIQRGAIDRWEADYLYQKLGQLAEQERELARYRPSREGRWSIENRAEALDRAIRKYETNAGYARSRVNRGGYYADRGWRNDDWRNDDWRDRYDD